MSDKSALWVEKYRPATLDGYIFQNAQHKKAFSNMISNRAIPHLLLSGIQGTGKTTIAQILIEQLNIDPTDLLVINASDETGVDTMRDKIKSFISTFSMSGIKIIQLEEADYLSQAAQAVLRKYTEDSNPEARFILTCNYEHKIMPAIRSRCQQYQFKASDKDDIAMFIAKILIEEKIDFDIELLDKYVAVGYPDIRKILNIVQQNSIAGTLQPLLDVSESGDYKFQILDLLTVDNWSAVRTVACNNVAKDEWEDLYRFLYENLAKSEKFSNPNNFDNGIIVIADFLYKNSAVADQEINFAACAIMLSQI